MFVMAIFSIALFQPVYAIETGLQTTANTAGFETATAKTPPQIVAGIIQIALGLVGVIFLILVIVSGFQWMMAGGNAETVTKSKKRITAATIGLIVILSAYALTSFIILKLVFL